MQYPGFASQPPRVVLPYQASRVQIVVVGAGGTGSWLVGHLARLVWDFNRTWERVHDQPSRRASLLIVDHDHVEEGNIRARQNFCPAEIGYPKARLLANRLGFAFGLSENEISAHVGPFTSSLLSPRHDTLKILVGCVDNASARQDMAHCLRPKMNEYWSGGPAAALPPLVWWVDSGNALHSGQVLCGNVATVEELRGVLADPACLRMPAPSLLHPELLIPLPEEEVDATDRLSCTDLVLAGEGAIQQSRTINNHMAAILYGYVEKLVYGGLTTFATYTDTATFTTRSLETTPEGLSQALGQPPSFFTTAAPVHDDEQNDDEEPEEEEDDLEDEEGDAEGVDEE